MTRLISLREYDYLIAGEKQDSLSGGSRRVVCIPEPAYRYLDRLLSRDEAKDYSDEHSFFLKRSSWQGKPAFQVQNFVGVLQTPCGTQIEIFPKTTMKGGDEEARTMLVCMLRCLRESRFRLGGDVQLNYEQMHLLEVFIGYFLREVSALVKKGVRSDYVMREENQQFLKGKLLVGRHIRVNAVQQQRFYCSHDEYLPDRAENRLIHRALQKIVRLSRSAENQRLGRELMFVFQEVPPSADVKKDFSLCRFNRATQHYRHALEWCRMILNEESSVPSAGKTRTISILFPMEKVFEDYVGWLLGRMEEVSGLGLQVSGKWLLQEPKKFQMRPDFRFSWKEKQERVIGDAKWKLLDGHAADEKCGVSQSDLYQLYAYGKKFEAGALMLFYPETDNFRDSKSWRFDDGLRLRLIPVPLPKREGWKDSFHDVLSKALSEHDTI